MSIPADRSPPFEEGRISTRVRSSSTPSSGTAVDGLTDDLLVEILSRVPAKSLCRFKCVSNNWLSLIDHPDHRKKLPQALAGFLHSSTYTDEWLLEAPIHFTGFPGRRCPPIDASCTFLPSHRHVDILDSCNGLLLCRWYDISSEGDQFRYVVCNPATEKWTVLPDSGKATKEVCAVRLGFDPALSSHFHVFELVTDQVVYWDPDIVGVAVYSSETGRWVYKEKRWDAHIRLISHDFASVFLSGYLHFQADRRELSPGLAVVDTEGETWMDLAVPDGGLIDGFIQRSQDRLHYASFHVDGAVIRLVVYVLENYESKEWILKHSVETSCLFGGIEYCLVGGMDYSMDGGFDWVAIDPECNLLFFTIGWENKLMCYSMDRRQVKMISKLVDGKPPYLPYVPLYAELQSLRN
ncbi:F-box protein At5g07610-like [Lolium perenne]|uniref:F-box protein At5g07610-like n=1 Tax=Lolium perenne TaxID=4522 RepID=UPI0021F64FA2|nr:F-box protein At5g07610-like [Lolium perenne]